MFLYLNIMVFYIYFQVWLCLFTEPLTKALKECFCIIFANLFPLALFLYCFYDEINHLMSILIFVFDKGSPPFILCFVVYFVAYMIFKYGLYIINYLALEQGIKKIFLSMCRK